MTTVLIDIPAERIKDWNSFHDVFAEVLGFPSFYGRNMNAWIDCMTDADRPETLMMAKAVQPGEKLTLRIKNAEVFRQRCPEQFDALIESADFVNFRRVETGGTPVLSLSLQDAPARDS